MSSLTNETKVNDLNRPIGVRYMDAILELMNNFTLREACPDWAKSDTAVEYLKKLLMSNTSNQESLYYQMLLDSMTNVKYATTLARWNIAVTVVDLVAERKAAEQNVKYLQEFINTYREVCEFLGNRSSTLSGHVSIAFISDESYRLREHLRKAKDMLDTCKAAFDEAEEEISALLKRAYADQVKSNVFSPIHEFGVSFLKRAAFPSDWGMSETLSAACHLGEIIDLPIIDPKLSTIRESLEECRTTIQTMINFQGKDILAQLKLWRAVGNLADEVDGLKDQLATCKASAAEAEQANMTNTVAEGEEAEPEGETVVAEAEGKGD